MGYVISHDLDADSVVAVRDAIVHEVVTEGKRLMDEILTGDLGERAVKTRKAEAAELKRKVVRYEEILGVGLSDLKRALDDKFASEVESILGAFECSAVIVFHDAEVTKVEEWQPSDGPLKLNPVGGGGTSHICVFDWLAASGRSPACVVALTDLVSEFPSTPPDVSVLWGVVGGNHAGPPFGTVVRLDG